MVWTECSRVVWTEATQSGWSVYDQDTISACRGDSGRRMFRADWYVWPGWSVFYIGGYFELRRNERIVCESFRREQDDVSYTDECTILQICTINTGFIAYFVTFSAFRHSGHCSHFE